MRALKISSRWLVAALLLLGSSVGHGADADLDAIAADLQSDDPAVKLEAARVLTLAPQDADRMVPLLVQALADERAGQKVPVLIPAPPRRVADQAQWALRRYGTAAVLPVTQSLQHEEASVRRRAADILAGIGANAVASSPALAKALAQEKEPSARSAILNAYGQVEQAPDKLAAVLITAMDDTLPDYYALAIRLAGERRVEDEAVVLRIRAALNDPNTRWGSWSPDTAFPVPVRQDAAQALGQIGKPAHEAASQLRDIMNSTLDENSRDTQAAAAMALIQVSGEVDQAALTHLIQIARHPDEDLSAAELAIEYLGELGPQAAQALPMLEKACFYDADNEDGFGASVRSEAILAVAKIGGAGTLPTLTKALQSDDAFDREAAAEAIGSLGPAAKSAVPALQEAVRNDRGILTYSARYQAIEALGKMAPTVKEAAAALQQIKSELTDEDLQEALQEALDTED